jgi:hypothetical protein
MSYVYYARLGIHNGCGLALHVCVNKVSAHDMCVCVCVCVCVCIKARKDVHVCACQIDVRCRSDSSVACMDVCVLPLGCVAGCMHACAHAHMRLWLASLRMMVMCMRM